MENEQHTHKPKGKLITADIQPVKVAEHSYQEIKRHFESLIRCDDKATVSEWISHLTSALESGHLQSETECSEVLEKLKKHSVEHPEQIFLSSDDTSTLGLLYGYPVRQPSRSKPIIAMPDSKPMIDVWEHYKRLVCQAAMIPPK